MREKQQNADHYDLRSEVITFLLHKTFRWNVRAIAFKWASGFLTLPSPPVERESLPRKKWGTRSPSPCNGEGEGGEETCEAFGKSGTTFRRNALYHYGGKQPNPDPYDLHNVSSLMLKPAIAE